MISNFKFRYNSSFTNEEKKRNEQKLEEEKRNKQKREEEKRNKILKLEEEKKFREEAEQIKIEGERYNKRIIHIQYQNKLKDILTKDMLYYIGLVQKYKFVYNKNNEDYIALEKLITFKIEELDKFLRIKGLRFPYNDLDIYLKNPEFLFKVAELKKHIEELNNKLHEKQILRQKILCEVLYFN
jgi:hypothetical protein